MKRALSKIMTALSYMDMGWKLGADLKSKWILAAALPALKLGFGQIVPQKRYKVNVRIGALRQNLFIRLEDVFIIREVFIESPYIHPDMKDAPPRCIVDLGAHIGLATIRFKAEFPDAEVHCYEPDPENFQLLRLNVRGIPGVFLHQEAVGSRCGEEVLYISEGRHAGSSLRPPSAGTQVHEVVCKVRSLDEILGSIQRPIDLIKFDIEGVENEVFEKSLLVHRVNWIVGEIKGSKVEVEGFVSLFKHHRAEIRWRTHKMAYVYLRRA